MDTDDDVDTELDVDRLVVVGVETLDDVDADDDVDTELDVERLWKRRVLSN